MYNTVKCTGHCADSNDHDTKAMFSLLVFFHKPTVGDLLLTLHVCCIAKKSYSKETGLTLFTIAFHYCLYVCLVFFCSLV